MWFRWYNGDDSDDDNDDDYEDHDHDHESGDDDNGDDDSGDDDDDNEEDDNDDDDDDDYEEDDNDDDNDDNDDNDDMMRRMESNITQVPAVIEWWITQVKWGILKWSHEYMTIGIKSIIGCMFGIEFIIALWLMIIWMLCWVSWRG